MTTDRIRQTRRPNRRRAGLLAALLASSVPFAPSAAAQGADEGADEGAAAQVAAAPAVPVPSVLAGDVPTADPVLRAMRDARGREAMRALGLDPIATGTIVPHGGAERALHHLPPSPNGWRLHGETAMLEWPVVATEAQIEGGVTLRIAYRNALSVMPETSRLEVRVNGVLVASPRIEAANGGLVEVPLGPHYLSPGVNALSVTARQRHRVDCSIEATHELWTEIDPAGTGLVFDRGNSVLSEPSHLGAMARDADGTIRVDLLAERVDERRATTLIDALQEVTLAGGFSAPRARFAARPGVGPGLDLFVGPREELGRIAPDLAARLGGRTGAQLLSRDGDERLALVVPIPGEEGLARLRAALEPAAEVTGTPEGRAARLRHEGVPARMGETLRFARLGLGGAEFAGRLYRRGFDVTLPPDALAADYAQADLTFTLGHRGGLRRDAVARVLVNGVPMAHLPLVSHGVRLLRDRSIELPLGAFRPGRNRIEIEASVPHADDATCTPATLLDTTPRFMLAGDGRLRVPRVARMGRLPDLGPLVGAGYPYVTTRERRAVSLVLPLPGEPGHREALNASAGLSARLARAAGVPLDVTARFGPVPDARDAIVIAPWARLGPGERAVVRGVEPAALVPWEAAPVLPDMPLVGAAFPETSAPPPGLDHTPTASIGGDEPELLDRWSRAADDGGGGPGWTELVSGALAGTATVMRAAPPTPIADAGDALLAQDLRPHGGVWTVLTAPEPSALVATVGALGDPLMASAVRGSTAALDVEDRAVRSVVSTRSAAPIADRSFGNLRLVLAGWLADRAPLFGALAMIGLVGLGTLTSAVLRRSGRRSGMAGGRTVAASATAPLAATAPIAASAPATGAVEGEAT